MCGKQPLVLTAQSRVLSAFSLNVNSSLKKKQKTKNNKSELACLTKKKKQQKTELVCV